MNPLFHSVIYRSLITFANEFICLNKEGAELTIYWATAVQKVCWNSREIEKNKWKYFLAPNTKESNNIAYLTNVILAMKNICICDLFPLSTSPSVTRKARPLIISMALSLDFKVLYLQIYVYKYMYCMYVCCWVSLLWSWYTIHTRWWYYSGSVTRWSPGKGGSRPQGLRVGA